MTIWRVCEMSGATWLMTAPSGLLRSRVRELAQKNARTAVKSLVLLGEIRVQVTEVDG